MESRVKVEELENRVKGVRVRVRVRLRGCLRGA